MEIPKPTDDDKAVFNSLVPDRPDVVVRPMFGNLGAYVNGNMFMGLFGPSIGVKLSEPDRESLLSIDGAGPLGPPERGWLRVRSSSTRWLVMQGLLDGTHRRSRAGFKVWWPCVSGSAPRLGRRSQPGQRRLRVRGWFRAPTGPPPARARPGSARPPRRVLDAC